MQKECVELHGTARRDRSRAAVIIKQKTMVDADNKEGVRAPMRVPVGARRSGVAETVTDRTRPRGKRTETRASEREAIFAMRKRERDEAAGAKDVVPRTAIDLIRALPDSFSVRRHRRRSAPLRDAMRCPLLGQNLAVLRSPLDLPAPLGFLI